MDAEAFEMRLRGNLDKVLNEKETFLDQWSEKRRQVVEPALKVAEKVYREKLRGALVEPKNGTITLYAGYRAHEHFLRFKPNSDRLEIECATGSFPKDGDPDKVTPDVEFLAVDEISLQKLEGIIFAFSGRVAREGRAAA